MTTPASKPTKDPKTTKDAKAQAAKDAKAARAAVSPAVDAAPTASAAPDAPGKVQLAISPWGEVEVDGVAKGITPPLAQLSLPPGRHRITVRNGEHAPYSVTLTVESEKTVTLRHRFGS
jgi:serine/threonine-protein kinase